MTPTGLAAEDNGRYIPTSSGGPFGPYTRRQVLLDLRGPVPGGGVPHQGGLVRTPNGAWCYLAFVDTCPRRRGARAGPVAWTWEGWPVAQSVNGAGGTSCPGPAMPPRQVTPMTGVDTFDSTTLADGSLHPGRPCRPKAPGATGLSGDREEPGSHKRSAVVLTCGRTPHCTDSSDNL